MLTNKEDIKAWLDKNGITKYGMTKYTINEDMTVDVDTSVNLTKKKLKKLPIQFGIIKGDFNCGENKLISLLGCPKIVHGFFMCNDNNLTSLEHSPQLIEDDFICSNNKLKNLVGCCQNIKGNLYVSNNKLTSLLGCPETIEGIFDCGDNQLASLEHSPKTIKGHFICRKNKLTSLLGGPTIVMKNYSCGENEIVNLDGFNCQHYTSFNHIGSIIKELEDYYEVKDNETKVMLSEDQLNKALLYKKLNTNLDDKLNNNKKIEKKIKI